MIYANVPDLGKTHTHTHSWCFIHKLETHIFWNQSTTMDEMQTTQVPLCDIIENNGG